MFGIETGGWQGGLAAIRREACFVCPCPQAGGAGPTAGGRSLDGNFVQRVNEMEKQPGRWRLGPAETGLPIPEIPDGNAL